MYHLVGDIKLDHSSTKIIQFIVAFVVNQRRLGVPAKYFLLGIASLPVYGV